ncbi:MAG: hypothetical protein ACRD45_01710 [Bryobacteraceae bacterium]
MPAALGGKTAIRSGFGIYHGDGQIEDQSLPISNEVKQYALSEATIQDLSFPITQFLNGWPGIVSARSMDRNRKDMYAAEYGTPQSDLSAGPGNFGAILTTLNTGPVGTGTPRQIQFMLRLRF